MLRCGAAYQRCGSAGDDELVSVHRTPYTIDRDEVDARRSPLPDQDDIGDAWRFTLDAERLTHEVNSGRERPHVATVLRARPGIRRCRAVDDGCGCTPTTASSETHPRRRRTGEVVPDRTCRDNSGYRRCRCSRSSYPRATVPCQVPGFRGARCHSGTRA